jgi:hypothetical protein
MSQVVGQGGCGEKLSILDCRLRPQHYEVACRTASAALRLGLAEGGERPALRSYLRRVRVLYVAGVSRTRGFPGETSTALPFRQTARGRPSRRCWATTLATADCNAASALRVSGFLDVLALFIVSSRKVSADTIYHHRWQSFHLDLQKSGAGCWWSCRIPAGYRAGVGRG